jgi:hypothetical protein
VAPLRRIAALAASLLVVGLTLTACATTVSLQPAEDGGNPLCAEVMVRLPGNLGGEDRRWTDAQSTGAWGDPASVIFACGVTPPGPTEARCITIGGVDWVIDESAAPKYRITTYGRTPAIEVFLDNEVVSSNDVLDRLAPLISGAIPAERACVAVDEVLPEG